VPKGLALLSEEHPAKVRAKALATRRARMQPQKKTRDRTFSIGQRGLGSGFESGDRFHGRDLLGPDRLVLYRRHYSFTLDGLRPAPIYGNESSCLGVSGARLAEQHRDGCLFFVGSVPVYAFEYDRELIGQRAEAFTTWGFVRLLLGSHAAIPPSLIAGPSALFCDAVAPKFVASSSANPILDSKTRLLADGSQSIVHIEV
jgi:hypothetical protein